LPLAAAGDGLGGAGVATGDGLADTLGGALNPGSACGAEEEPPLHPIEPSRTPAASANVVAIRPDPVLTGEE
jgi:hypothetical protein